MGNNLPSCLHPQPLKSLDFTSYEQACRTDPDVKKVDDKFKDHTGNVLNALAHGIDGNSLSFDSLKEVTTSLLEMDHEVVQVILDYKDDVWKNPELFLLVEEFFDNSLSTLEFCSATENSIKRARDNQLVLNVALNHMPSDMDPAQSEVERILSELNAFRETGNPFDEDFVRKFRDVQERHSLMLETLMDKKRRLDKKLKKIKMWAKVSSIIFAAVVGAVLICSVVAAAIAAPPIAGALAAAVSFPLTAMGSWVKSLWSGYENEINLQKDVLHSVRLGTVYAIRDLETIKVMVRGLEIQLESIAASIKFSEDRRDAVALKLAIVDICAKRAAFVTQLDDLEAHIDRVGQRIREARAAVLLKITKRTDRKKRHGSF